MHRLAVLLVLFCIAQTLDARQWDFTLHKHDTGLDGPTLLVIGGIQGDEPGGFNAASLLVTEYAITRGQLWVVPNLNFESIIKRSRGVHGDMNRKFKDIVQTDPEFELVQKIKSIITDEQVDIILNLHDGSGFYRPDDIDRLRNSSKWGQSIIIDQADIDVPKFGELNTIASEIASTVNSRFIDMDYKYYVKNTRTRLGDREMEKTLTYYAINRGKSAFGIEASKEFNTHRRAYAHLQVIEAFMNLLGIEYQRNFALTEAAVRQRIDNNVKLALYESKLFFDMADARKRLNFIPMKRGEPVEYVASNPLIAVVDRQQQYKVHYGNRRITTLKPQFMYFDNSIDAIGIQVDGSYRNASFGDVVQVKDWFRIMPLENYRINVIGFTRAGVSNEQDIRIRNADILERYSVDRKGKLYRVEVYREKHFCGMILVRFTDSSVAKSSYGKTDDS